MSALGQELFDSNLGLLDLPGINLAEPQAHTGLRQPVKDIGLGDGCEAAILYLGNDSWIQVVNAVVAGLWCVPLTSE